MFSKNNKFLKEREKAQISGIRDYSYRTCSIEMITREYYEQLYGPRFDN